MSDFYVQRDKCDNCLKKTFPVNKVFCAVVFPDDPCDVVWCQECLEAAIQAIKEAEKEAEREHE